MLGLRFCARAFSSCGERGPLFIAVRGPLTIAASLVAEHRLQTRRLSSCGSRAQLLCGMWDLPRPGVEPVSPALAGGFSTTAPPGKPIFSFKKILFWPHHMASRIVVPQPGIEHSPMEVKARPPNHSTAREFPPFYYCYYSRFIWKILDCHHIESVNMFSHSFTGKVLE